MESKVTKVRQLRLVSDSKQLADVTRLWRSNSATLGFFTAGAFQEYAAKGQVLIAEDDSGQCVGYALYRTSRDVVVLVHLCVAAEQRSSGVARALIEGIKSITQSMRGIRLSCRRDYSVSALWPRLGFVAMNDRTGRSAERKPLTTWWLDFGHPDLLSSINYITTVGSPKLPVVLDANVFFDLDEQSDLESEESKTLTADWIQANVELFVTREILNEIDRQNDAAKRQQERVRVVQFPMVQYELAQYEQFVDEIRTLYDMPITIQDESDIRQLAYTLAGGMQFFVTRDVGIINRGDDLYKKYGLTVMRPVDLVVHLDSIESEADYRPVRLAGTRLEHRLVRVGELEQLVSRFQADATGERAAPLRKTLTMLLSNPEKCRCYVVCDDHKEMLALYAKREVDETLTEVPLLRVNAKDLDATLARYLSAQMHWHSASHRPAITKICDKFLKPTIKRTLTDSGYSHAHGSWIRVGLPTVGSSIEIGEILSALANVHTEIGAQLKSLSNTLVNQSLENDPFSLSKLETALWPAKITDLTIRNYIIPIQAPWARELFDEELARQDLLGAQLDLALQQEGVYYRTTHFTKPIAPARILWYVSHRKNIHGSGHIRACSWLDEVVIGKPKDLYKAFRRLGIYEWRDVYATARHDINSDIMALRFSQTELLSKPISWGILQEFLQDCGISTNVRSPVEINTERFINLYEMGKKR